MSDKTLSFQKGYKAFRMSKLTGPILVTGAGGFIGRRLINRLLSEGHQVIGFDVLACPESLQSNEQMTWIKGDITNQQSITKAVEQSNIVFHLAAMVGDWGQADIHEAVTVTGTKYLFEAALNSSKTTRVVLASSIVVYGDQIDQKVCDEGLSHGQSHGPYSESKQKQEVLAQKFLQNGLDIRVVRPANVYGAGSKPWVEDLCKELKRGTPCLIGGGDFDAGLVHVDNVIEVMIRASRAQQAQGQIFNASDDFGITWKRYLTDMAKLCAAPAPKSIPKILAKSMAMGLEKAFSLARIETRPPLTREAINLVGSNHRIDMEKTKSLLGFKPIISYEQGLAEIRDYLEV